MALNASEAVFFIASHTFDAVCTICEFAILSLMLFTVSDTFSFQISNAILIPSTIAVKCFLIVSPISFAFAEISSQCLYSRTPMAMSAVMTPMTINTGADIADMAAINPDAIDMIEPIPVTSLPIIMRTGPTAATIPAILMMCSFVSSSSAINLSIAPCTFSMTGTRYCAANCPRDVINTSRDDFSFSIEPPKPPIIAFAISVVVPSCSSAVFNSCTSVGAVLMSANHFDIWFLPNIALAAAICSDSDSVPNASWSSC